MTMLALLLGAAPADRVEQAREQTSAKIESAFRRAGVPYPAPELYFRAFKHDRVAELWGAPKVAGKMKRIGVWKVLAASGTLGPKRMEGDFQVPEGFYVIDRFNPQSQFWLSMRLNYPNQSDRILSDPRRPGGDIYVHGKRASNGCLAMGDPAINALYLAAWDAHQGGAPSIRFDIFPAKNMEAQAREFPQWKAFWAPLRVALDNFERTGRPPTFSVRRDGAYAVRPVRP